MRNESGYNKDKSSVNLSCRIGKTEYDLLLIDSRKKGISLNSYVNSIIKRYLSWERYAEEVGFIPLSKRATMQIFDKLNERSINEIAADVGQTVPRELTMLMFNKLDFSSVMSMIEITSARVGVLRHNIMGSKHNFTLYHGVNKKFSQYVARVFESMGEDLSIKLKVSHVNKNILSVEVEELGNVLD